MTFSVTHQVLACVCYRKAGGNEQQAAQALRSELQELGLPVPANCKSYVATWGPRMQHDGSIEGHAADSGRKPALTDAQIATCHAEATGWFAAGRAGPYSSMEELVTNNPKVQAIVAAANITPQTLCRHIKAAFPGFRYGKAAIKDALTDVHRRERVAACKRNLQMSQRQLHLAVWVDSKSMILVIKSRCGWLDTNVCDYEVRKRPPQCGSQIINLKYYIAVNALLGPVWLAFTTGTTGMPGNRGGHNYKVRSCHKQARAAPPTRMRRRRLELGSPTLCTHTHMFIAARVQPQHTETISHCCSGQQAVFLCPGTQATVSIVCTCVVLACVLLPMHFNQQVGWNQCHGIPPVPIEVQRAAIADRQLHAATGGMDLNSIELNEWLLVHAFI